MSVDERPPKRKRQDSEMHLSTPTIEVDSEIELAADGDALVVVNGIAGVPQQVGIRCSSYALGTHSTGFKQLLAAATVVHTADPPTKTLPLPDDDGNTIYLLCCALHLRHDKLPARLPPDALTRYVAAAARYDCIVAAGRAASPWFDHLYHRVPHPPVYQLLEAAYLLDDPVYFARFTTRWVLETPSGRRLHDLSSSLGSAGQRLALELLARQREAIHSLKVDLDLLIDPLADVLADESHHYIDCEPGEEPQDGNGGDDGVEEDDRARDTCPVDRDNARLCLSALRNANLWPATRWPSTPGAIVEKSLAFPLPEWDVREQCLWCVAVEAKFSQALALVRTMQRERLWGICLDCYHRKAAEGGGVNSSSSGGECRFEHVKAVDLSVAVPPAPPPSGSALALALPSSAARPAPPKTPLSAAQAVSFLDSFRAATKKEGGDGNGQGQGQGGSGGGGGGGGSGGGQASAGG
ncbi:Hypothetical predicted protein [Lecanosticta acicola]|uniref:BTB domain-containing protein n=1 Tax=Lecanosticta acicola TaxID=111012 RepID=A0AAI8YSC1_9PEZI|nr:Hypothetical predicted protein [Lecanosticta acicola]